MRTLLAPAVVMMTLAAALGQGAPGETGKADDAAAAPAPLVETSRLVDEANERVSILSNGLTVLLKAHRTAPVVSVRMYCRTGSIYEQEYLGSGMSHLFEHLLHGGATTTRSEEASAELLNAIGGNSNAYTSYDVTCYYIDTTPQHLPTAVNLLGDWLTHPTFPQAAFDREWGVVQRELERDVDSPDRQLFQMTMETMFREHPARYPVIGYQPVVQRLAKEDIVGYYQRMYVPDNIVVCIVGDIDLDRTLDTVRGEFAGFGRRKVPTITLPVEPPMTTPRFSIKRMKVETAMMALAFPSIPLIHQDLYALDVLSYILTQGDSSRLATAIRDAGLVYSIDSSSWTPQWGTGIFMLTARLAPDQIDGARRAILDQIALLQKDPVSDAELEQAKRQKASDHVFGSQTAESVAEMMAQDYLSSGDVHFSQSYVDRIQQVTPEQIREMARKYLRPEHMATILVAPEDYQPSAGQSVTATETAPVKLIRLDNGLRGLIRTDTTSPLVAIQAYTLGGVAYEDEHANGLSRLAALLATRGTATRDAAEIARFFDARGGTLGGMSGTNTVYFQAQVLKGDFAEAMDVFADVVVNPAFAADQLEVIRPQALDAIRQIDESWRSELLSFFRASFFEHSGYRFDPSGSPEVVASATPEQIRKFYRDRLTGPQTVVAVFGDVDEKAAENLIRKHFSGLPGGNTSPPGEAEATPPAPKLYVKAKPPERQVAGIAIGFEGMTFDNTRDAAPLAVLDTIISGYRYPTGWLHENLRGGNTSLVYEVHAQNVPGLLPGYFGMYAACQPDKVNEVYRIVTTQFKRARAGKFTPEELERARAIIETTELLDRQTNSDAAMQASLDELYGLGYDYRRRFIEEARKVTLDDVRRVADAYLTTPVITVVTPAPELVEIGLKPIRVDAARAGASEGAQP